MRTIHATRAVIGLGLAACVLAACTSKSASGTLPTHLGPSGASSSATSSAAPGPTDAAYADPAAVQAVLDTAQRDFPLLTEYDYRHLADDLARAKAVMTASFTNTYVTTMRETIAPLAATQHVVQTTTVVKVGLVGLGDTQAEALVFADEKVTNTKSPKPQANAVVASVVFTKVGSQWKVSSLRSGSADPVSVPVTRQLEQALTVGQGEVSALFTYHRRTYAQDLATAEAGASGHLLTDVKAQAAKVQAQLITDKYDLTAELHATAVEAVEPREVLLLVAADSYQVPDHGSRTLRERERLEVDVVFDGAHWHVDNVTPVT